MICKVLQGTELQTSKAASDKKKFHFRDLLKKVPVSLHKSFKINNDKIDIFCLGNSSVVPS